MALGEDYRELDRIIVSHEHLDHIACLEPAIEAMTNATLKHRGKVYLSKNALNHLSNFHKSLTDVAVIGPFDRVEERFVLSAYPVEHTDETGFGFILEIDGKRIAYTSDTHFFDKIIDYYKGVDVLIANSFKLKDDGYWGHLTVEDLSKALPKINPKLTVLTHFSPNIVDEKDALKLAKEHYDGNIIAAKDGMRINI